MSLSSLSVEGREERDGVIFYKIIMKFMNGDVSIVWRRFSDFENLRDSICQVFPNLPELPQKFPFSNYFEFVLDERTKKFSNFLENLISVDPFISSAAFRLFLGIREVIDNIDSDTQRSESHGLSIGGFNIPTDAGDLILDYLTVSEICKDISVISRNFRVSARSHNFSRIYFSCDYFETRQRGLYNILTVSQSRLLALSLNVKFGDGRGFLNFPKDIHFSSLKRVELIGIGEDPICEFFSQILLSIDSQIEKLKITAPFDSALIAAVAGLDLLSLKFLKIGWISFSEISEVKGIRELLLRVKNHIHEIEINRISPLNQFSGDFDVFDIFLEMPNLKKLKFDFLNDSLIQRFLRFPSFSVDSVLTDFKLSGIRDPLIKVDQVVKFLLPKLPTSLRNLEICIFEDSDQDWLFRGYVPNPVGSLSESWSNLRNLEKLILHGTAIDNEGLESLARNCTELRYLEICSHMEFVTDAGIDSIIDNCPLLESLIIKGSAEWLTDNCLMKIARSLNSSHLTKIEIQKTRHMSWLGSDALLASIAEFKPQCEFHLFDSSVQEELKEEDERTLQLFNSSFAFSLTGS